MTVAIRDHAGAAHRLGSRTRQRGIALMTALLVVSLATVAAVAMTARQQIDIRRTGNVLALEQAQLIGLGVEAYAMQLLSQLEAVTDLPWTGCRSPEIPFELEGAAIRLWLEDLHCRFNLNSLTPGNAEALKSFEALVAAISARADGNLIDAGLIGRSVQDWLDPETDDSLYLANDPPYLSANQPMLDASELRLVTGVDQAVWQRLAPHVVALPAETKMRLLGAPEVIRQAFGEPVEGDQPASRFYRLAVEVRLGRHRTLQCSLLDVTERRVVLRELAACGP